MSALSARGVTVARGGRLVVEDVSFTAPSGSVTCLLGTAGAGKTTLLAALAGLLKLERGAVFLGSAEVTRLSPRRRGVGLLPPGTALPDSVGVQAALRSVAGRANAASVAKRLDELGLRSLALHPVGELSHGQAALVLAAARLAPTGDALLMDEATAGLGDAEANAVMALLRREADGERAVLMATRSPGIALLAEHLVLLSEGRVLQAGPPDSLYAEPRDAVAARLTGAANILAGTVRELRAGGFIWAAGSRHVQAVGADQPRPTLGSPVALCLRPERVALLREGEAADNLVEGVVVEARFLGGRVELAVRTSLGVVLATAPCAVGGAVRLGWAAEAASVMEESK